MKARISGIVSLLLFAALVTSSTAVMSQGPQEGIKVHGLWTIDVLAPDGTLVSHREFQNALTDYGRSLMAGILGRVTTTSNWRVELGAATNPPCVPSCYVAEPTSAVFANGATYPNIFPTLVMSVPAVGTPDYRKVVLKGTATAVRAGQVSFVATALSTCAWAAPTCNNYSALPFTEAQLATPIVVIEGQIIQVTVVLSFS